MCINITWCVFYTLNPLNDSPRRLKRPLIKKFSHLINMATKRIRNSTIQNVEIPLPLKQKTINSGRIILLIHLSINEKDELTSNNLPIGINAIKTKPNYTKYFSVSTETETFIYMFFKILTQVDVNMITQIKTILEFTFQQKNYIHDIIICLNKTPQLNNAFNKALIVKNNEDYSNISILAISNSTCSKLNPLSQEYNDIIDDIEDETILEDSTLFENYLTSFSYIFLPTIPENTKPFRKVLNVSYENTNKNYYKISKLFIEFIINCKYNTSSKYILDQWFINEILTQPPCAKGRFKQFTGTCWFNTILHSLILSPRLSTKLLNLWNDFKETNKDLAFIIKNIPFPYGWTDQVDDTNRNVFIFYIVYNIIDMKYRPDYISDIPSILAETCNLINKKTKHSIDIVIKTMFPNNVYIKDIIDSSPLSTALYNYQSNTPDNNTIVIEDIFDSKQYDLLLLKFYKHNIKVSKIPRVIKVGNITYTLECGGLRPRHNHAISGIICNDSKDSSFIYDSNNYLTVTDWFNGNLDNYYREYTQHKEEGYPELTFAIYIKLL